MTEKRKDTYPFVVPVELTLDEIVELIVLGSGVDPLELIKRIDLLVADCDFTRRVFEWSKEQWAEDCQDIEDGGAE